MFFRKKKKEFENTEEILKAFKKLEKEVRELEKLTQKIEEESVFNFQKTGIVRFNPFTGVGGNQSFSLCMLNKKNDGFIITSFYTREGSSVYGKPVQDGKSEYKISEEEKEALNMAMGVEENKRKKIKVKKKK